MRYLFAFLFPPLAVLMCGKPIQAIFVSVPLTMLLWLPGVIHALVVAGNWRDRHTIETRIVTKFRRGG